MTGWLTQGFPQFPLYTGLELFYADTESAQGAQPESIAINGVGLATYALYYGNFSSKTTVAGSRYFTSLVLGPLPQNSGANATGSFTLGSPMTVTGLQVLIGSVGGTDTWLVELHNSAGVLVATSATTGVTAGTAGTWQQIAFTAPVVLQPGTYFAVLQTNGTTAHPAVYNFPAPATPAPQPILTGSSTGTFGTSASITPPTVYAQAVGPVILPY